jgi:hypothetical protein
LPIWQRTTNSQLLKLRNQGSNDFQINMNLEKVFSRGKNIILESSSIGVCMEKWWTQKIVSFITWQNWELSRFLRRNPMIFYNFDVVSTTTHRIYYRRGGGASFPSWAMMCFMSSTCLCFISCTILASTCTNFVFTYSLRRLISPWAIVYEFILIPIPRSHPYFYFGNYFCILS